MGSALATLVGVVIPFIQIISHPQLSSLQQGFLASAGLIGIMTGCILIGHLCDKYGYLSFFRLCPSIVLVISIIAVFVKDPNTLIFLLFTIGIGIGGEYSLDPDYISEIMPVRWKLIMVGVAKSACSLGNIFMALACFIIIRHYDTAYIWDRLFLIISGIAFVMIITRVRFKESPGWLITHGKTEEAEKNIKYFLGKDVVLGAFEHKKQISSSVKTAWKDLFKKHNIRKVIIGGIPWACEGVGVYGVGIFTPVLLLSLKLESVQATPFLHVLSSIKLTAVINLFILLGFVIGLILVKKKINHILIQSIGFIMCSVGVLMMLLANIYSLPFWVSILGFIVFEIFLNAGPHLITFILPTQIYPIQQLGSGVGLCAAIGKLGAIIGVFFIPVLIKWGGNTLVLSFIILVSIIGAMVTYIVGREIERDEKAEAWRF